MADRRLTAKDRKFILEYLRDFNGTQAAIRAGFSKKTAYSIASELLRKPELAEYIQAELQSIGMQINEILGRLTMQARGNLSEFIDFAYEPVMDRDNRRVGERQVVHIKPGAFEDRGHLIKSISPVSSGGFRVEMYSAQEALQILGKINNLMSDRVELSGGPLKVIVEYADGQSEAAEVASGATEDQE